METYVKSFCDKYYVVTSKRDANYKRMNHDFSLHDTAIIDAYFDILTIAEELIVTYQSPIEYMNNIINIAKRYNCEIIEYASDDDFVFPAFNSIQDATDFKSAIDAQLLLIGMRDER